MGLFKKKLKIEMHGYVNGQEVELKEEKSPKSKEQIWHDLTILENVKREIKPLEDIVVSFAVELQGRHSVDDEIALLESIISSYDDLRRKCYSLGKDYQDYFIKGWATVLDGKPDGPDYITRYKKRLAFIRENYDTLIEKERRRNKNLVGLEKSVMAYIKVSQPVLQTDICKAFDESVTADIKDMLYHMDKDGVISRVKSGRTYIITLN